MNTKNLLIQEVEQVSNPGLEEVLGFLRFLKAKKIDDEQDIAL